VEAVTEEVVAQGPLRAGSQLRTPRAAAAAGIIFSVLLIAALVLLRVSVPAHTAVPGAWLTNSRRRGTVAIARHTSIVARWLTIAGLVIALVLLVAAGTVPWVELLFPAWILALSIDILVRGSRASAGGNPARPA
jgi:hypothetical protein